MTVKLKAKKRTMTKRNVDQDGDCDDYDYDNDGNDNNDNDDSEDNSDHVGTVMVATVISLYRACSARSTILNCQTKHEWIGVSVSLTRA